MENLHVHLLQKLCRLCKHTIVLKHGYKTAKAVEEFTNSIYTIYNVDVDLEDFDVFPKSLCGSCVRKIQRSEKKQPIHLEAPIFIPHSNNCNICEITPPFSGLHIKQADIEMLQNGFVKAVENQSNFKRIYVRSSVEKERLVNEISVFIHNDNSWHCNVHNKTVKLENENFKDLPKVLSDCNIKLFSAKFGNLNVCQSISGFTDVIQARLDIKQPFRDAKGNSIVGFIEDDLHNPLIKENFMNVRHSSCLFFSDANLCEVCSNYTNFLRSCKSRISADEPERKKARVSDMSRTNYRFLSRDELEDRLANTQKQKKEAIQKVNRLSKIVGDFIQSDGVVLENNDHDVFKTILNEQNIEFDAETPQGLLWQQQKEQLNKKDSRGMRWHPLIIRWCLSIYYSSPKAYNQMSSKRLNFLRLPHINTLKKYTQFTSSTSGFNPDIIQRLIEESGVSSLPDWQKNVSLCYDEMQIKSNLVYKKSTGQMIGFTEMGDVNEEFRSFKENVEKVDNETSSSDSVHLERSFATHVIVYMVRGIFTGLAYPFGYFASTGFSAAQLYPCTMEATRILTAIGFRVCTYVSDGASPNRKFYKIILANDDDDNIFWSWNPYDCLFKVYCISDVPHLIKTTRNCLENSNWNKNTRNLHLDGQDISWKQIIDVYEWDLGMHRGAPGLRKLHKIKEEHIKLAPRMRMQVRLATQVLSETVAQALEMQDLHNTKSLINFVRIINRVFDCLNVSNRKENNLGRPELQPYKNPTDWRFKFLEEDFISNYLNRWEAVANATVGMTQEEKNRLLLSKQTQHGWRMTVKSFIAIAKELLLEDGSRFILSEKFSQDPLEEHFAKQRLRGGCNDNPDLSQFGNQELILNVMSSGLIKELRGNTRSANRNEQPLDVHDMRQLPKKRTR